MVQFYLFFPLFGPFPKEKVFLPNRGVLKTTLPITGLKKINVLIPVVMELVEGKNLRLIQVKVLKLGPVNS